MSLQSLFNQSIQIYSKTSYDKYGKLVVGSATSLAVRFQQTTKKRLLPNGDVVTITGIVYVPPDTTVGADDKIRYSGQDYRVFGKYVAVDGDGATNHIKLELTEWQT